MLPKSTSHLVNKNWFSFCLGGLLGIIVFLILYGTITLNPTNVEWIYDNHCPLDIAQHYFGWAFYRNGDWMWPVGLTNTLSYPLTSSIVFTDSIPHWAFFFKLLSPILPDHFQYFGWFTLLSYALLGGFSALVIKRLTNNPFYAILGSLFFLFSSLLPSRVFNHTALSCHWIIIFCLYIYFCGNDYSAKKATLLWTLVLWIAAGTHISLLALCGIILFFYAIRTLRHHRILPSLGMLTLPTLVSAATIYFYGGFTSDTNPVGTVNDIGGLGWFGINCNSLINPTGVVASTFLPSLPVWSEETDDRCAYLGIGVLIMAVACVIPQMVSMVQKKRHITVGPWIWTAAMAIGLTVFAFSPRITCGSRILFEYHPPKSLLFIWETFRATSRFFWPVFYLLLIGILVGFYRIISKARLSIGLLIVAVSLQLIDLYPSAKATANTRLHPQCQPRTLSPQWDELMSDKEALVFMPCNDTSIHCGE